jgi:2-keto-4-pentenoate hydratase
VPETATGTLADVVADARARRVTVAGGGHGDVTLDEALRIQAAAYEPREPVGWKLGLISPAKQEQMGIDEPLYGPIHPEMLHADELDLSTFIQPRMEPELAVVLAADVAAGADEQEAAAALGPFFLGVDVLDSIWDGYRFTLPEVVADGLSGGGFVLGERIVGFDPRATLSLHLDGRQVSSGAVADLGAPAQRLAWLAERVGGLRAGQIVFLGSPAAAQPASAGTLEARGPHGSVLLAGLR